MTLDYCRYLGLPKVKSLLESDEHETVTKTKLPKEHLLNDTVRAKLIDFFDPFNRLLQEFLQEVKAGNASLVHT